MNPATLGYKFGIDPSTNKVYNNHIIDGSGEIQNPVEEEEEDDSSSCTNPFGCGGGGNPFGGGGGNPFGGGGGSSSCESW
ncbi:MAG: hypothetical protein QF704_02745 [Anaerolineales bacterium]|nr:hypothetical protein [Anaerolineales bacterium]